MEKSNFKNRNIFFLALFLGFLLFAPAVSVYAKKTIMDAEDILRKQVAPKTGVSTEDLTSHTGSIIQGALKGIGLAFLVLMVYGGLRWMSARGNEADIEAAKETIIAAIIGLVIVVGAYAITNFVTKRFILKETGGAGTLDGGGTEEGPTGCCEFKINEIPTWTAFMMTEAACKATCVESLGESNCGNDDYIWTEDLPLDQCEARRQDALR